MFEKFTDRARRVVVMAQEEARMLSHNYIGTEHLLLGILHEGDGASPWGLESLGISLEAARQEVLSVIGRGDQGPAGHIPFTPRAKKVLELSLREATELGHRHIGPEHLLLGLIREGDGVGVQVLVTLAGDLELVRRQVSKALRRPVQAEAKDDRAVEKLTERAQWVVVLAQEEARMLGHARIGAEHLLLGLIHEGDELARALEPLGIGLSAVRGQVEQIVGRGEGEPEGDIPFTLRARQVLERSQDEAMRLGHDRIATGHIMLGLLQGESVAAYALANLGADLDRVREEATRSLARLPKASESPQAKNGEATAN